MTVETEREAVYAALSTIRPYTLDDLRLVHIKNTRDLGEFRVSTACLRDLEGLAGVFVDPMPRALSFADSGELI